MSEFLPIADITMPDVDELIDRVLRGDVTLSELRSYLASIDWSSRDSADDAVANALGAIEGTVAAFDEGELEEAGFATSLLSLLSVDAQPTVKIVKGSTELTVQGRAARELRVESVLLSPVAGLTVTAGQSDRRPRAVLSTPPSGLAAAR